MFKIIAIICAVSYGGHVLDCTRMEETDRRTFTAYEACIEEAGYKHKQIADILTRPEFSEEHFTLRVSCEQIIKHSYNL